MRVLICGSRDWIDWAAIRKHVKHFQSNGTLTFIIEGEARGADRLARFTAEELGIPFVGFPADWKLYGLGAGRIRNKQMLDEGKPDWVLAFHDGLAKSAGTKNMVKQALAAQLSVVHIAHYHDGTTGARGIYKVEDI